MQTANSFLSLSAGDSPSVSIAHTSLAYPTFYNKFSVYPVQIDLLFLNNLRFHTLEILKVSIFLGSENKNLESIAI